MANINSGVLDGIRRIGAKVRDLTIDGGVPGAPLGYRLRGATASGAPQTGTWKTGDAVPDRSGAIWICTSGGTGPAATWARSGLPVTATVSSWLAQPQAMMSHRGYTQVAPEDTMVAFRSAIASLTSLGYVPAIKLDVQQLGDGSLAVMHDNTVNRTTTSSGALTNYTAATWQTLVCPASTLVGPAWPNQPVPMFTDVLNEFGGKCVIMIDPKSSNTANVSAILAAITTRGLQKSCLITYEDTPLALPGMCQAAGVGFWYYWNLNAVTSPVTPSQAAQTPGVTGLLIGIANAVEPTAGYTGYTDANVSSVVSAAVAAGIPAGGFSYMRRITYAHAVSLGLTVHLIDDPYVITSTPLTTSDRFAIGAPLPGEPGTDDHYMVTEPGFQFAGAPGYYRRAMLPTPVAGGVWECLGFLSPVAFTSNAYTLGATVFWDATETGDAGGTRFAGAIVACPDDEPYDGNPECNGYHCLIRQGNGSTYAVPTMQIYKIARGAYQNNGTYASGTSTQEATTNCTTGYAAPNTLGAGITSGATITSLTLGSAVTIPAGMQIALANGQIAIVASPVTASTAVTISSLTAASAVANGSAVSFGIPFTVKVDTSVGGQTTITFKRTDTGDTATFTDTSSPYSGQYCHIGKTGDSPGGTLAVSFANVSA